MTTGCERRQLSGKSLGRAVCGCFALVVLAAGCNTEPPPVDLKAAEDAIRAADAAQLKAAQALDVAGMVAVYSDDAVVLPPNEPAAADRASIQKIWAAMLVPGTTVNWLPAKVEVAASGDLGYDQGMYSVTGPGSNADTGKTLSVWRKQADGSWKCIEDTWNSDLPAVVPVAVKKKGK